MKNTINFSYFRNWFLNSQYKNNFSIEGLSSLYDYLVNLEEELETEFDFDPIAFSCEYSEYENLEEIKNNYSSVEINNIDDLRYHTNVIEVDDSNKLIIQDF